MIARLRGWCSCWCSWWSDRRDSARRCHDTHHAPRTVPGTPNDLARGRRHRVVCARCGRRLA